MPNQLLFFVSSGVPVVHISPVRERKESPDKRTDRTGIFFPPPCFWGFFLYDKKQYTWQSWIAKKGNIDEILFNNNRLLFPLCRYFAGKSHDGSG